VGVYDLETMAQAAIGRPKGKPGFADAREGFQIHRYELNKDHWTDGFVIVD
jgi:hypothetical protein